MKVYILLAEGFEEIEAVAPGDILRRGGVEVEYASASGEPVKGARGISIVPDTTINKITADPGDYIIIPGGLRGVENLESDAEVSALLPAAAKNGVTLCAICAGPRVLSRLDLLNGKNITCYPGMEPQMTGAICHPEKSVVTDGDRITGRAAGAAIDFGLAILKEIMGEKAASSVCGGLVYGK